MDALNETVRYRELQSTDTGDALEVVPLLVGLHGRTNLILQPVPPDRNSLQEKSTVCGGEVRIGKSETYTLVCEPESDIFQPQIVPS